MNFHVMLDIGCWITILCSIWHYKVYAALCWVLSMWCQISHNSVSFEEPNHSFVKCIYYLLWSWKCEFKLITYAWLFPLDGSLKMSDVFCSSSDRIFPLFFITNCEGLFMKPQWGSQISFMTMHSYISAYPLHRGLGSKKLKFNLSGVIK